MFYSPSTNGFYSPEINGDNMPGDVVEISAEQYALLLQGQGSGLTIVADQAGMPTLVEPSVTPVVPRAVTMRQARLALLQAGLLPAVNAAVSSMEGAAGEAARIEWEYSQEVQRDKALVLALAPVLGFSEAQLDALFVAAAAL